MVSIPSIGLFDVCLGLVYILIFYLIAYWVKKKNENQSQIYKPIFLCLSAKLLGAILFVSLFLFYYQKGDSFLYFQIGSDLRAHIFIDFPETIKIIFSPYSELQNFDFNPLEQYNYYYDRVTTWSFSRIFFFINLMGFGSYLVSSLLMSGISFIGLWLGYLNLVKIYSKARQLLIVSLFFIPTSLIWTSGILKDTLIIGFIGLILYAFINLLHLRKKLILNFLLLAFSLFIISVLRPIMLFILVPGLTIWALPFFLDRIKNYKNRLLIGASIFITVIGIGYLINMNLLAENSKYRVENLITTLNGYQLDHTMNAVKKNESSYNFGKISSLPLDQLKRIPMAINVTFFRPYPWEVKNLPTLFGSIESMLLLLILIYLIIKLRWQFFIGIINNRTVFFFICISIFSAVVVGMSAYNFGALSRFKAPAMIFLMIGLSINSAYAKDKS